MINQAKMKVKLIMEPTIREEDGLAMSSRNRQLSPDERKQAVQLSEILSRLGQAEGDLQDLVPPALTELEHAFGEDNVDYLESRDLDSFEQTKKIPAVACAAVRLGNVRLIDNVIIS